MLVLSMLRGVLPKSAPGVNLCNKSAQEMSPTIYLLKYLFECTLVNCEKLDI